MPRKKKAAAEAAAPETTTAQEAAPTTTATAVAVAEPEPREATTPAEPASPSPLSDHDDRQEPPKNWGDPYKSIFSCPEQGFELGENRRFKQRVFAFGERPSPDVIAELKDLGFTYRAGEKAWTVPATPDSRKLTDKLARKWAGPDYVRGTER